MKRSLFLTLLTLFVGGTASAWKIEGRITGVDDKDSVKVRIFRIWHNSGVSFDTDTIRDGRFSFSGTLPAGERAKMTISSSTGRYTGSLWMTDTTRMQITGRATVTGRRSATNPNRRSRRRYGLWICPIWMP